MLLQLLLLMLLNLPKILLVPPRNVVIATSSIESARLKAIMFAIAGSTSARLNSSNARVTNTELPYSLRVIETVVGVDSATASGSVVSDRAVVCFLPSQRTSVELQLSLELIDGQVFYLRLNELVVQNGEQTPISGHTLAGQDLHHQRFLQVWTNLYLYMH
jgi:hypothetical protein